MIHHTLHAAVFDMLTSPSRLNYRLIMFVKYAPRPMPFSRFYRLMCEGRPMPPEVYAYVTDMVGHDPDYVSIQRLLSLFFFQVADILTCLLFRRTCRKLWACFY